MYTPLSPPQVQNNTNLKCDEHPPETDESDDNMENCIDDSIFVPSPKSEAEEEEAEDVKEEEDYEEYYPKAKRQKQVEKKNRNEIKPEENSKKLQKRKISIRGKRIIPPDDPGLKGKRKFKKTKREVHNYQKRKTQVPSPCWECELVNQAFYLLFLIVSSFNCKLHQNF